MSSYQTGGGTASESLRAEAARRGVSVYQVRLERFQHGQGANPRSIKIRWNKLTPKEIDWIKRYVKRRRWRAVVNKMLENREHWDSTGDNIDDYDYWSFFEPEIEAWKSEHASYFEEDGMTVPIYWYHGFVR